MNIEISKIKKVKDEKVIMMIGATGVGKTTLINRMINYIFSVSYSDPFRFKLIKETRLSEIESHTQDIYIYTIHYENLPYNLAIIDTPGFSSTLGRNEDKATIDKIRGLFKSGQVEAVNTICIVEKYTTNRLSENLVYTLRTISGIFSNDVSDAIVIMATHCDDSYDDITPSDPQSLECLRKQKIPFKLHYIFNNKTIYKKPLRNTGFLRDQIEHGFWDSSTKSFKAFFEKVEGTIPISLTLSKEILQEKYNIINAQLPYLIRVLTTSIHEIETIKQDKKICEQLIDNPDKSHFTEEVEIISKDVVDIEEPNKFTTWCENCNCACHYPCEIHKDNIICKTLWWCSAMSWFNPLDIHCTVCIGKCSWRDHRQIKKKEIFRCFKEIRDIESLQQRYIQNKKKEIYRLDEACEEKMVLAYDKLLKDFKEIKYCIDYINEHTLSSVPTTIKEYVDDIIETEEENKEDGYIQRIHYLKRLVTMKDEDTPADEVHQAISFIQSIKLA